MAPTAGDPSNPFVKANTVPVAASSIGAGAVPVTKAAGGLAGFAARALGDASGMLTGAAGGVAHTAADLGKSAVNAVRQAPLVHGIPGVGLKQLPGESNAAYTQRVFPIARDVVGPTVGTARTVAGGAQGAAGLAHVDIGHGLSHETATRYSEHPLGSLVSDALGASMVLGPLDSIAGGALGEGSTAGAALTKAAEATHAVANAPMKPFEFAGGKVLATEPVANLVERMKAGAAARSFTAENLLQPSADARGDVAQAFVPLAKLAKDNPDAAAAATLVARNEFGLTAPAIAKLAPAEQDALFARIAAARDEPGLTPGALRLAFEHTVASDAHPELAAATEPVGALRAARQERDLAGVGMAGGAKLNPEQAGFYPLTPAQEAADQKLSAAAKPATGNVVEANVTDAGAAPARLRPMLLAAKDTIEHLKAAGHGDVAAEITPTLEAIRNAGVDAEHVIGGKDRPAGGNPARPGLPTERKTGAQFQRLGNTTEFTAHGQAGLEMTRALQGVRNTFAQKAAETFGQSADQVDQGAGLTGASLAAAAKEQGLKAWDPTRANGRFNGGELRDNQVDRATVFMPARMFDALKKQESSIPEPGSPGAALDRISQVVRKNPLLLSPTYHLRIAASNAAMLGIQGDLALNPLELARRGAEASKMLREGTAPRALLRGGLFGDEQALMDARHAGEDQGAAAKAVHTPVAVGQKVAATIDNFSRVMAYLGEKSKGYSDIEAVSRANDAVGNFNAMSPAERNVIGRVFPIYPWVKQVLKVAARVGMEHPIASAFVLHAGDMFTRNQPAGLPTYLKGAMHVGGGWMPTDLANPLSVLTSPPGSLLSPLVKAPIELGTGLSPTTARPLTSPRTAADGTPGALWKHPGEAAYVLAGMNPLSRFARDETAKGGNIARYQTGEPKLTKANGYRPQPGSAPGGKLAPLASIAGLPIPQKVDLAKNTTAAAKRAAASKKAAAIYKARLKGAGLG